MPSNVDLDIRYINDSEAVSNLKSVHVRDDAGNIILLSGSAENSLLVIEPIKKEYTVESILRILDTNFEYYSFPVQTIETFESDIIDTINKEIEKDTADIADQIDVIFARYKPSVDQTIIAQGPKYGLVMFDEVYDGIPQKRKNFYTITKDIKDSGKNLRFRIKITHRSKTETGGTIYWSVNKEGPDLQPIPTYGDGLNDGKGGRSWASVASATDAMYSITRRVLARVQDIIRQINSEAFDYFSYTNYDAAAIDKLQISASGLLTAEQEQLINTILNDWSQINDYDINKILTPLDTWLYGETDDKYGKRLSNAEEREYGRNKEAVQLIRNSANVLYTEYKNQLQDNRWGQIANFNTQIVWIDFVIPNSSFNAGESFSISAVTDQPNTHEVIAGQSYWSVTDASKNVDTFNVKIK